MSSLKRGKGMPRTRQILLLILTITLITTITNIQVKAADLSSYDTIDKCIERQTDLATKAQLLRDNFIAEEKIAPLSLEWQQIEEKKRTLSRYEVYKEGFKVEVSAELQWYIYDICQKYNIPETYIYGTILRESTFNEKASDGHSYGMMQISKWPIDNIHGEEMWGDKSYKQLDLLNQYDNILFGVSLMRYFCDQNNYDPFTEEGLKKLTIHYACGSFSGSVSSYATVVKKYYTNTAKKYADELVPLFTL